MDGVCVTCSLLLLTVALASASVIPPDSALHRNARAASCNVGDGRTIPDGQNFTRVETGPCVTYVCTNGDVLPLDYKCYRDGQCYPLQDVYNLGCIERTCSLTGGRFEYVVTREACTGRNASTCVDVGTTYKDRCFGYRCDKVQETSFSVSYHLRQVEIGCELDGTCVPINHTYTKGCRTVQCQQRFMGVGFFDVNNGCQFNGQCVAVGHTIEQNCRSFTCTQQEINGINVLNIVPTGLKCKDAYDQCHEPGEWFPLLVDNEIPVNCTCSLPDNGLLEVELKCPAIGLGMSAGHQ